jgi:hypothetical protein
MIFQRIMLPFLFFSLFLLCPAHARQNLALFRPITASSVGNSHYAQEANDNSLTSRWQAAPVDSGWIMVDLGIRYTVDSVVILWQNAAALEYKIQVCDSALSTDDGWQTAAAITDGASGETRIIRCTPFTGRYIRMRGIKLSTIWGYSIFDFQVYGTSAACIAPHIAADPGDRTFTNGLPTSFFVDAHGSDMAYQWQGSATGSAWSDIANAALPCYAFKPVPADSGALFRCIATSSCGADTSNPASLSFSKKAKINLACKKAAKESSAEYGKFFGALAVDDDSSTRWGSDYKIGDPDSAWMYVDLGAVYTIDSVFLNWENSGGREYYVQTALAASDNDIGWTNVAHVTDGQGYEKRSITFAPAATRFVRTRCVQRVSGFGFSLYEMEVYNSKGTTPAISLYKHDNRIFIQQTSRAVFVSTASGCADPVGIAVFTAAGKQVYNRCISGKGIIDWDLRDAQYAPVCNGIYIMRISAGDELIQKKVAVFR